ncbi:MAG: hypothetical protein JSS02_15885 [Planctomycetes bacterium]|nr:hypothetical protein [Planctomycetota bacterium]
MTERDHILQQALALPAHDQAYVVQELENHLIATLCSETEEAIGIADQGLLAELRRRSAAFRDGTTTARDAADVMAGLRQRQARELNKTS